MPDVKIPARALDHLTVARQLMTLLPVGRWWSRSEATDRFRMLAGLAGSIASLLERALGWAVAEAFPPTAVLQISDWERVLGLPEPCLPVSGLSLAERQVQIKEKLARRPGRQDLAYFAEIAQRLGYSSAPSASGAELGAELTFMLGGGQQVLFREYSPFQCGLSQVGVSMFFGTSNARWQIGPPSMRFYWKMTVPGARTSWFQCGPTHSQLGRDPLVRIRRAEDLECILQKLKPAHTTLLFDYQGI